MTRQELFTKMLDAVHEYHRSFIHDQSLDQAKVEAAFDELKDAIFNLDETDFGKDAPHVIDRGGNRASFGGKLVGMGF
jgi:hypothetical protein